MPFASFAFLIVCFAPKAQAYEVAKRYGQAVKVTGEYRIAFADEGLAKKYNALLQEVVDDFNALPCGPRLKIVMMESADIIVKSGELPKTFAAHTERKLRGRRVMGATITLNSAFSFSALIPQPVPSLSIGRTLRHEIGHALGLEHSRKKGALMHAASPKNGKGNPFTFDDLMAFCHLYQD